MACYHPIHSYWRTDIDGSRDKVFENNFDKPFVQKDGYIFSEKILLPCGQCIGCRLEYSRQWATRCVLEASQWKHNYFVTLTYNDLWVPRNHFESLDYYTGEVFDDESLSLKYDDVQNFMKRLRTNLKRKFDFPLDGQPGVRFYGCSEYGPTTDRPHYHLILFNCPIPDLKFEANNFRGDCYYSSEFLTDCWSVFDKSTGIRSPIGFVTIGEVSFDSAAYCARYMLKKHKGLDSDFYKNHHKEPECSFMSRKPGIARSYFDDNSEKIYMYDQIIITGTDGKAKRVRPPRYYDNLYDIFSPEDFERVKQCRKDIGENVHKRIEERTDLCYEDYLKVAESCISSKVSSLKRNL